MIICLSGFVIAGASPAAGRARSDPTAGAGVALSAYSPHHHQLLQHFAPRHLQHATRAGRCSSSSESVSSRSASPPPHAAHAPHAPHAAHAPHPPHPHSAAHAALPHAPHPSRVTRVRTLYACVGESEGELSFEPNQIITNVSASAEPGWLRGSLNGKSGLVPQNYVEPLP